MNIQQHYGINSTEPAYGIRKKYNEAEIILSLHIPTS